MDFMGFVDYVYIYIYIYWYWYWYCGLNIFEYIWWILWTFAVSQFGCRIPLIFTRLPHTASSRVGIKTTAFVPTGPARLLETNSHDNIKIYQAHHKNRYQWTNERNERGCNLALNCSHLETQTRLTRLSDSSQTSKQILWLWAKESGSLKVKTSTNLNSFD